MTVKRPIPWISTIRVFSIDHAEIKMMMHLYGTGCLHCNVDHLEISASVANEIIYNLIEETRHGKA